MQKEKMSVTRNPFVSALTAALYIVVVACVMYYGLKNNKVESILIPIAMLSLFTLSTAVMGFLFILEPIRMYLDGKKKEAVHHFFMTILSFAVITGLIFVALFLKAL